jgi:hypothetical protein
LQPGLVEDIESQFFIGEHGEGSAFGTGDELGGFLNRQVWILADHRHDHANHDLQATNLLGFLFHIMGLRFRQGSPGSRNTQRRIEHIELDVLDGTAVAPLQYIPHPILSWFEPIQSTLRKAEQAPTFA